MQGNWLPALGRKGGVSISPIRAARSPELFQREELFESRRVGLKFMAALRVSPC
jgi:hypothetical protein